MILHSIVAVFFRLDVMGFSYKKSLIGNSVVLTGLLWLLALTGNAQYQVNGNAVATSCNCYTLTNAANSQVGSVWNTNLIDLNNPFNFTFDVFLGNNNGGADGIVFGLQPNGTSVGTSGGGLGMGGVVPSVGVYLDTWQNGNHADPVDDHIAIQANGDLNHTSANNLAGPATVANIEDGQWHTLNVDWDPATNTMTVTFDGAVVATYTGNIIATIFGGNPNVYWGFTAATGGANNLQQFCTQLSAGISIPSSTACLTETISFTDSSLTFGAVASYDWDFGDGTSSTLANPSHSYAAVGTYPVKLVIEDNSGCLDSATAFITILPVPDAGIGDSIELCDNVPVQELFNSLGGFPQTTGFWNGPGPLGGGHLGEFDPATNVGGDYDYIIPEVGVCPADTATITVELDNFPNAGTAGGPIDICSNDPIFNLFDELGGTPATTGIWNGPSAATNGHLGTFDPATMAGGNYTYSIATAGVCPDATANVPVNLGVLNDPGQMAQVDLCRNAGPYNLIDYLNGTPEPGGQWFNPGNFPVAMPMSGAQLQNGTYTYGFNIGGICEASTTLDVTIVIPPNSGQNNSVAVCEADTAFNMFDSIPGTPDPGGFWLDPNGNTHAEWFTPSTSSAGIYRYVVNGMVPCAADTSYLSVAVRFPQVPNFTVTNPEGCLPHRALVENLLDSTGIDEVFWTFGNGRVSSAWDPRVRFFEPGCYSVSMRVTTTTGCVALVERDSAICVLPTPVAEYDYFPKQADALNPKVQFLNSSTNATQYDWEFGGLGFSALEHPKYLFPAEANLHYTCLIASNEFQCADTTCAWVEIKEAELVFAPNAFTPDGDGLNEVFRPVLTYTPTQYRLRIYDRWGAQIFESTDPDQGWDGKVSGGNLAPLGVYIWYLEVEGAETGRRQLTNEITIIH